MGNVGLSRRVKETWYGSAQADKESEGGDSKLRRSKATEDNKNNKHRKQIK